MNENYTALSTTSNILQCIFDVLLTLDKNNIDVPQDSQEVMSDIQATVARKSGQVNHVI